MLKRIIALLGITLILAGSTDAEELSLEQQRQIIERYMYVTGQITERPASLGDADVVAPVPEKCGTPAILDFHRNYDRFDRRLLSSLGVEADIPRPVMQAQYGVPGGHTLIHYDTTGTNAVWQAEVDGDGDGVPDYIEDVAAAAEESYVHIVDSLGYSPPLTDSLCLAGGDGRVDIYLKALSYEFYGWTRSQSECYDPDIQHEASWIVIDHDFQHFSHYVGRPLDAAKVTLAHEIFHTIHFSLDATEHVTWFEMSSVWMEEEVYDEINDYYLYDHIFFGRPDVSLQDTIIVGHMYQAAVFPIYLTEKYGRDAIKAVWERSAALGLGPHYLRAFDLVIDSASTDPANAEYECLCYTPDSSICLNQVLIRRDFASALAEFAIWNFFTGPYAAMAPDGVGYSEAEYYDYIPLDAMDVRYHYPLNVGYSDNKHEPAANAAIYIRLENLQSINLDSLLTMWITPDRNAIVRWGVSGIFQMENDSSSHAVVTEVVDVWETDFCQSWTCTTWDYPSGADSVCIDSICDNTEQRPGRWLGEMLGEWVCTDGVFGHDPLYCDSSTCYDSVRVINLEPYRSLTLVMTPSSLNVGPYSFGDSVEIGFSVNDISFVNPSFVDLQPAVLTPYPNPAVVSEMGNDSLTFRFQTPTDITGFPISNTATLQLDIFTVAGEKVRSVDRVFEGIIRDGPRPGGVFNMGWDMRNQTGQDVASGVYLVVARLYEGTSKNKPLIQDRTKVVVIR